MSSLKVHMLKARSPAGDVIERELVHEDSNLISGLTH